jgi:phage terminase large subunit GpA-like protein
MGIEGQILAGLKELVAGLLAREYRLSSGLGVIRVSKLLCDGGYKPAVVQAVKREVGGAVMDMSKGDGITAARKPMSTYVPKPGERHGNNWYFPVVAKTREIPYCRYDSNHWKSFVARGLSTPEGDPGSISLFGSASTRHRLLAEHLAASETYAETIGQGRKVWEWKAVPNRDNHWLDCMVYSAVGASIMGMKTIEDDAAPERGRRKARSFAEAKANRKVVNR